MKFWEKCWCNKAVLSK